MFLSETKGRCPVCSQIKGVLIQLFDYTSCMVHHVHHVRMSLCFSSRDGSTICDQLCWMWEADSMAEGRYPQAQETGCTHL